MKTKDNTKLKGFFRVQITEDDKVVGDSGWKENQVTNLGIQDYLVDWLVGDTASGKSITHLALGTGTAPASNGTSLAGEVTKRAAVSTSIISSRTAQFTAQFASSASFVGTGGANIANIGLFNTSAAGTIFAGNIYSSSACASNQNVNATYFILRPLLVTIVEKLSKLRETLNKIIKTIRSEAQQWERSTTIMGASLLG